jgi:hypothetical protein
MEASISGFFAGLAVFLRGAAIVDNLPEGKGKMSSFQIPFPWRSSVD